MGVGESLAHSLSRFGCRLTQGTRPFINQGRGDETSELRLEKKKKREKSDEMDNK
jgi:hypothetical protein